ncbi:Hypothetical protein PHPALM_20328 [Phytophthora palmivora]|uniref:Uncharacterized protein n=1 Tax=Phytophthora palmivora TaxID=4796 RepID=A0A2P4XF44_9STRA|nr:Hypothetical protein PHPALM_20328 [Phytophthora palmivora]
MKSGIWSRDEHERYCEALEIFRYGSWKQIAEYVGSRTERQVLSHAQSIRARKKKDEERRQTESTSKLKAVDQDAITPVSSTPNLLKTQQFTSEELLATSMTGH